MLGVPGSLRSKLIRMEQPTDQGWMSALEAAEWHRSRSIEYEVLRRYKVAMCWCRFDV
jgi:hypothetical protein